MGKKKFTHADPVAHAIEKRLSQLGLTKEDLENLLSVKSQFYNKSGGFSSVEGVRNLFTKTLVSKLYLVTGIHPEEFLIQDPEEERKTIERKKYEYRNKKNKFKVENYFTNKFWEKLKPYFSRSHTFLDYIQLENQGIKKDPDLESAYERIVDKYIRNAQLSIRIYDTLFRGDKHDPDVYVAYQTAQQHIFKGIEEKLSHQKGLSPFYYRYLVISRHDELIPKNEPHYYKRAMVIEASTGCLQHMMRCLENYPKQCSFFVTKPIWYRHMMVIDDYYAFTEDYLVSFDGVVMPYGIFIDDVSREGVMHTKKIFMEQLETYRDKYSIQNKDDLEDCVIDTALYFERKIKERESTLKSLRKYFSGGNASLSIQNLINREKKVLDTFYLIGKNITGKINALGLKSRYFEITGREP